MTSDLNSVTSTTYVAMSFWSLKASVSLMKGEVQRGHVDLRGSPQVKILRCKIQKENGEMALWRITYNTNA